MRINIHFGMSEILRYFGAIFGLDSANRAKILCDLWNLVCALPSLQDSATPNRSNPKNIILARIEKSQNRDSSLRYRSAQNDKHFIFHTTHKGRKMIT
ncbi:hypothetical protein ACWIUD_07775 [Helicobacter sp. 23-1044]